MKESPTLIRLFIEHARLSLLVVGGGYAIVATADERFGRKLHWLKEGELSDRLVLFASFPGLIAGNAAIYTGLRTRGRIGALVSLAGTVLPSLAVFLVVSSCSEMIPTECPAVTSAFAGLRAALTGIIISSLVQAFRVKATDIIVDTRIDAPSLSRRQLTAAVLAAVAILSALEALCPPLPFLFLGIGCLAVGGGFPLVPIYAATFCGPHAPFLSMPKHDFGNLIALTQLTPGPVSVNAATYFGYQLHGILGGIVATVALVLPSYVFLSSFLCNLTRLGTGKSFSVIIRLAKAFGLTMMAVALYKFATMSVITTEGGLALHPPAALLAIVVAILAHLRRFPVVALIILSGIAGSLFL